MQESTPAEPIEAFNRYWREALKDTPLKHRGAVCVSTIGEGGYPNSRFVDLKLADRRGLVFCTSLDSAKARDIERNAKAGLTAWWDHIGIQARFQGVCVPIAAEEADSYWAPRSRGARLASAGFNQSAPLEAPGLLLTGLEAARSRHADRGVERPASWGGYRLVPVYVELMEFRDDRLHVRTCYSRVGDTWERGYLQP